MRWIILILFGVILYSLGSASYAMLTNKHEGKAMAKALTWRISLSLLAFFLLLLGFLLGWIQPHGLVPSQVSHQSLQGQNYGIQRH